MGTLRDAIRQFEAEPSLHVCRAPEKLVAAHTELDRRLGQTAVKQPDTQRLLRAYRALQEIADNGGRGMEAMSLADLKNAPWVLFQPITDGAEPLATSTVLVKAYLKEVFARARASVTVALLASFLMLYPTQLPVFHAVRRTLAAHMLPRASGPRIEKWRACIERCHLLDEDAPARLATALADADVAHALLERCCLRGLLVDSALVHQAYRSWIGKVSAELRAQRQTNTSLERLLTFARAPGDQAGVRYESSRVALADGLLLPFTDADPGPAAARRVKDFLLDTLGDPRLTGAKRWHGVDERARAVMLGWLVTATLEDFFRLLEYAAKHDETAARHWKARKAFWSRYLRAGHIHDAWVALGPATEVEARGFLSKASRMYAKLKGAGVKPNHSVIIMRVGSLTITEWSHVGKFRAWYAANGKPPRLHQRAYTRSVLIDHGDKELSHHSRWQDKVAEVIYQQTGLTP